MKGEVKHVFSLGGGYHHALPERASGFCVFNDPAIAIRHLQKKYKLKKILYIDIDAHHGDGVQWIFYSDPSVMTISLHESGRYLFPGTGAIDEVGKNDAAGTSINIPFPMDATDNAYVYAFEEVVAPLVRSYKPEFMLCQCGGDAHFMDPLTHLALTTRGYGAISKMYRQLADEVMDGRYICVTGGGYDALACARSWTVMFSEMVGFALDNKIPKDFATLCKKTLGFEPPGVLNDDEKIVEDESRIMDVTENVVREIKRKLFPLHGL
jgi:acetoin utilization protein AcuC